MFGRYSEIAKWLHSISGGKTGSRLARLRRQEDIEACKILGVTNRHFRWRDAVYRKGRTGKFLYNECKQETRHVDDESLISDIATTLHCELSHEVRLFIPLGVGSHVDHLIVRQAAEKSGQGRQAYYPEVPYAQLFPDQTTPKVAGLQSFCFDVNSDQTARWIQAIKCYASQRRMLEEAAGPLPELINKYANSGKLFFHHSTRNSMVDLFGSNFQLSDRRIAVDKAG